MDTEALIYIKDLLNIEAFNIWAKSNGTATSLKDIITQIKSKEYKESSRLSQVKETSTQTKTE